MYRPGKYIGEKPSSHANGLHLSKGKTRSSLAWATRYTDEE
ncbi:hypothetical protein CJF30_00009038 [Rutstroemia sp. NJR-2017a BBW]|nr:hypothetical protein CJF30_00009038 [Rutstroemia sp. NJR-2017a BBW]